MKISTSATLLAHGPPVLKNARLMLQTTETRGRDHLLPSLATSRPALMLPRQTLLAASLRFHFRRTINPRQDSTGDRIPELSTQLAVDPQSTATHPPRPCPYLQLCLPQTASKLLGASRTTVRNSSTSPRSLTLPFCPAHLPSTPGILRPSKASVPELKDQVEGLHLLSHLSIRVGKRRSKLSRTFSGEARLHLRRGRGTLPSKAAASSPIGMSNHTHMFANGFGNPPARVATLAFGLGSTP